MADPIDLRIFISSPSDVRPERLIAERVIKRLGLEFSYHFRLSAVLWEREPLLAGHHFQDPENIPHPSGMDIVIVIIWSRLGIALPDRFRGAISGREVTGTEWEFEEALAAYRRQHRPDLLVYRKTKPSAGNRDNRDEIVEHWRQQDLVRDFMARWFESSDGQGFTAAFARITGEVRDEAADSTATGPAAFDDRTDFEDLLEEQLRTLLRRRLSDLNPGAGGSVNEIRWFRGSPWLGLRAFNLDDAAIFFGRRRDKNALVDLLQRQIERDEAFILVMGASGVGKSSVVKAALLPDLLLPGMIGDTALVRWASFRPGDGTDGPVGALGAALLQATALPELEALGYTLAEIVRQLRTDAANAQFMLRQALGQAARAAGVVAPATAALVVIVDQFEEIFTIDASAEEQEAFVAAIESLSRSGQARVIATMRSDFFDRLATLPRLSALSAGEARYLLLPPTGAEIAQMTRFPAREAGLRFAEDPVTGETLDEVIRHATEANPGALPLLSFLLDRLWQLRDANGVLTFAAYRQLGGLEGALAASAEDLLATRPAGEQAALPHVLRELVTVQGGADGAIATRPVELARFEPGTPERALIEAFLDPAARLLVAEADATDAAPRLRLAHEALISHWARARAIIDVARGDLDLRAGLERDAQAWQAESDLSRRAELLLPPGLRLDRAQDYASRCPGELAPLLHDYISMSRAARDEELGRRAAVERARVEAEQQIEHERLAREAERASLRAEAARRLAGRTRIGLVAAVSLALIASVAGFAAWQQRGTAIANASRADTAAEEARVNAAAAEDAARRAQARETEARQALTKAEQAESRLRADEAGRAGAPAEQLRIALQGLPLRLDAPERGFAPETLGIALAAATALPERWITHAPAKVRVIAANANGTRLATMGDDWQVRLLDAADGTELAHLANCPSPERPAAGSIAFVPGSDMIVVICDGHAVRWDGRPDSAAVPLDTGNDQVIGVRVSGDGQRIVTLPAAVTGEQNSQISPDGTHVTGPSTSYRPARLHDARTGAMLAVLAGGTTSKDSLPVQEARFSADSRFVAADGGDQTIRIWRAADGRPLATLPAGGLVWALDIAPDATRLATVVYRMAATASTSGAASRAGQGNATTPSEWAASLSLWDVAKAKLIKTVDVLPSVNANDVPELVFNRAGTSLLVADRTNGRAALHDGQSGERLASLTADRSNFSAAGIGFHGDGGEILAVSGYGLVTRWDGRSGAAHGQFANAAVEEPVATFDAAGTMLALAGKDNNLHIWRTTNETGISTSGDGGQSGRIARFTPGGRLLTLANDDTVIKQWDAATGANLGELHLKLESRPTDITTDPTGATIAVATTGGKISLIDSGTGDRRAELQGHTDWVWSVRFSADGNYLFSTSRDRTARIWDPRTGAPLARLAGHGDWVRSIDADPAHQRVVTASDDKTARLWRLPGGASLSILRGHTAEVLSARFSPDGDRVITASADGTAAIWDADRGTRLMVLRGHKGLVTAAMFAPGGAFALTAGDDGTARIWDARTGRQRQVLAGHTGRIWSAAISPDGRFALTGGEDGNALLWDIASGAAVQRLAAGGSPVMSVAVSPDGARIAAVGTDGIARLAPVIRDTPTDRLALARVINPASPTGAERLARGVRGDPVPDPDPDATPCDTFAHPWDPGRKSPGMRSDLLFARASEDGESFDAGQCRDALRLHPNEPRLHYQLGRTLAMASQKATDPGRRAALGEQAIKEMRAAADAGYAFAWFSLGSLLETGTPGAPQDLPGAIAAYRTALTMGAECAAVQLADMQWRGTGMPADQPAALALWAGHRSKAGACADEWRARLADETGDSATALTYWLLAEADNDVAADLPAALVARGRRITLGHQLPVSVVATAWREAQRGAPTVSSQITAPVTEPSAAPPDPAPISEDTAIRDAERHIEAANKTLAAAPADFAALSGVAEALGRAVDLRQERGEATGPLIPPMQDILARISAAAADSPATLNLRRRLGAALVSEGNLEAALPVLREAETLARRRHEAASGDIEAIGELSRILCERGTAEPAGNATAAAALEESFALANTLAAGAGDNTAWLAIQARAQQQLGIRAADGGRTDDALDHFRRAIFIAGDILSRVPRADMQEVQNAARDAIAGLSLPGMNIGLVVNARGKVAMVYDRPMNAAPKMVIYHEDFRALDVILEGGLHLALDWEANDEMNSYLRGLEKILIIRMENKKPVEGFDTDLVVDRNGLDLPNRRSMTMEP